MHYHSPFLAPHLARASFALADPSLGLPANVGLYSEEAGNSVEFGEAAYAVALGEYLERQHFFNFVPVDAVGTLQRQCAPQLTASLVRAFEQTAHASSRPRINDHEFELVHATDLLSGQKTLIPRCVVALTHDNDRPDADIFPIRDTSGCAVHCSPEASLDATLREFAERQTLVAAWCLGQSRAEITGLSGFYRGRRRTQAAYDHLAAAGYVRLLWLDAGLSGYCIFAFFVAYRQTDIAKFACGMSYHYDPMLAAEKALLELWHTYVSVPRKIEDANMPDSRVDRLDQYLLAFNGCDAADRLRFYRAAHPGHCLGTLPVDAFVAQSTSNRADLIRSVSEISPCLSWYTNSMVLRGSLLIFSRIISPDFFLHIDPSKSLNLRNSFSDSLNIDWSQFDFSPIPFP